MNIYFNTNFSSIELFFQELKLNTNKIKIFYSHIKDIDSNYAITSKEPKNINEYLEFCKLNKIDLFYPWYNIKNIYKNKKKFEEIGVSILLPTQNLKDFNLIENKYEFYKKMKKIIPQNIIPFEKINNKNDFDIKYNFMKNKDNQICIKPSIGIYAAGFKLILENENMFEIMQKGKDKYIIDKNYLKSILPEKFDNQLLMEYIDGDEFSYDIFAKNGKIKFGTIRQKHKNNSKYQTIIKNKEITKITKKITKKLKLSNFINFQFIQDNKSKKIYILEINPRMSGGIPQCNLSGLNYSKLFLKNFKGKKIQKDLKKQKTELKVFKKTIYYID
jgi:carbamoylphosphate synthase large subunit